MSLDKKDPKDVILRDYLAVDRTRLANQRTFLSMLRTGLYFMVMGLSILSLTALEDLQKSAPAFFLIGAIFIIVGAFNHRKMDKRIQEMYRSKRP